MLTSLETKILKKIAEIQLVTKFELKQTIGIDSPKVDVATKNLINKKLISIINPVGSTCFIITQQGAKELSNL